MLSLFWCSILLSRLRRQNENFKFTSLSFLHAFYNIGVCFHKATNVEAKRASYVPVNAAYHQFNIRLHPHLSYEGPSPTSEEKPVQGLIDHVTKVSTKWKALDKEYANYLQSIIIRCLFNQAAKKVQVLRSCNRRGSCNGADLA